MNQQNIDKDKVIINTYETEASGLKHIDTTMIIGSLGLRQVYHTHGGRYVYMR
jgi:hypothetical protein